LPLYEFQCERCGKITEKLYRMSDSSMPYKCDCGATAKKIISRLGIVRVGDGKLYGIDDSDDLTLGKIIANRGMPAEHKRKYAESRKRQKALFEYEKGLKEREKKYNFSAEETKSSRIDCG